MESPDLAGMRAEYASTGLSEADAGDEPLTLFSTWLAQAVDAGIHEPNAMALATADAHGVPSVRLVLLKSLDERGAVFFTSYASRKGSELATNPRAAAVLLWHPLQRQVRIEGSVARVDAAESDAYFAGRPPGARVAAAASAQSRPIDDRAELERRFDALEVQGDPDRPATWGGYRMSLDVIEFWQGRPNRLHDRLRFARAGEGWSRARLQP